LQSDIYWIGAGLGGRLAIMARPRAGDWLEDEIANWQAAGINIVVTLLEVSEVTELGLQQEAALCQAQEIGFISFPISDRQVPMSRRETVILVDRLADCIALGKSVAIHCRAGIGRSALIAACVLGRTGADANQAFAMISAARGVAVPDTDAQRDWVSAFNAYTSIGRTAGTT
jgi:protein-tyrosine phosphatase